MRQCFDWQSLASLCLLMLLGTSGCGVRAEPACAPEPIASIETLDPGSGAEDIVALPLGDGRTRLFIREACKPGSCKERRGRIGRVDLAPDGTPSHTEAAWPPPASAVPEKFQPLGLSLVAGDRPGNATLFVLDLSEGSGVWRLPIVNGEIGTEGAVRLPDHAAPSADAKTSLLTEGNDLQGVDHRAYVTRFDPFGLLPWRSSGWPGLAQVDKDGVTPLADGLRGANGILDLGPERGLLVADYWGMRLRLVSYDTRSHEPPAYATSTLPIHPDNLTLADGRILIAGQEHWLAVAANLRFPSFPSPSAVYEIAVDKLGPNGKPDLLWRGDWSTGKSVSVAVPVPGGLALGQIVVPGILRIACQGVRP